MLGDVDVGGFRGVFSEVETLDLVSVIFPGWLRWNERPYGLAPLSLATRPSRRPPTEHISGHVQSFGSHESTNPHSRGPHFLADHPHPVTHPRNLRQRLRRRGMRHNTCSRLLEDIIRHRMTQHTPGIRLIKPAFIRDLSERSFFIGGEAYRHAKAINGLEADEAVDLLGC